MSLCAKHRATFRLRPVLTILAQQLINFLSQLRASVKGRSFPFSKAKFMNPYTFIRQHDFFNSSILISIQLTITAISGATLYKTSSSPTTCLVWTVMPRTYMRSLTMSSRTSMSNRVLTKNGTWPFSAPLYASVSAIWDTSPSVCDSKHATSCSVVRDTMAL